MSYKSLLTSGARVPVQKTVEALQPVPSPAGTCQPLSMQKLRAPLGDLSDQEKCARKKDFFGVLVQMGLLNK